ncbi:hypothetical protein [Amycolatopsis sp. NPDC098790]|uniref:hypothetical protein n=1 Tax=Amycolatopsis sp. NPDC098790 TaxID=3363939 RepID=UPI003830510A
MVRGHRLRDGPGSSAAGRLGWAEREWRRADGYHSRLLGSDVGEARVRDELRNPPG